MSASAGAGASSYEGSTLTSPTAIRRGRSQASSALDRLADGRERVDARR